MQAQSRPSYESSSSKAYDALMDQLENLPSPSNEPEITFNEPAPAPAEQNNDAHIAPPTIAGNFSISLTITLSIFVYNLR